MSPKKGPSGTLPWGSRVQSGDTQPIVATGKVMPDPEPGDLVVLRSDVDLGDMGIIARGSRCIYVSRGEVEGRTGQLPGWVLFATTGQRFTVLNRWCFYREVEETATKAQRRRVRGF